MLTKSSNKTAARRTIFAVTLIAGIMAFNSYSLSADFKTGLDAFAKKDYPTAVAEWTPLAEQGDATAQSHLGVLYALGRGVDQSYSTALKWFRAAAEQKHSQAEFNVGLIYARGQGVDQDLKEAVRWYALAASRKHRRAQNELGLMYRSGRGVEKDVAKAIELFRQSAELRFPPARINLAIAYAKGQGVKQDYTTAYMWADLARARNYLTSLKRAMTPTQVAEAKKRAEEVRLKEKTEDQNNTADDAPGGAK